MSKTTLLVLLLAALVPSHSYADIISDMIGNWSGKAAVYDGGTKIADANVTSKVVRYGKRGMKSTGTVRAPGEPIATSIGWHNDDGTLLGVVRQGGRATSVIEGKWRIQGNSIIATTTVRSLFGDWTQSVRTTRVNSRKFDAQSTTSSGLRVVGSINKRR